MPFPRHKSLNVGHMVAIEIEVRSNFFTGTTFFILPEELSQKAWPMLGFLNKFT